MPSVTFGLHLTKIPSIFAIKKGLSKLVGGYLENNGVLISINLKPPKTQPVASTKNGYEFPMVFSRVCGGDQLWVLEVMKLEMFTFFCLIVTRKIGEDFHPF